jgi:hypothetical protein
VRRRASIGSPALGDPRSTRYEGNTCIPFSCAPSLESVMALAADLFRPCAKFPLAQL